MTSAQEIIDQELAQFGWVESNATNSISDFKSPKINLKKQASNKKESDLIDTFMIHLIFYVVFCLSLFLYIFIDLDFASFIKNKLRELNKIKRRFYLTTPSDLLPINSGPR